MNIIVALLIFAFLIFFHELGHFTFAKLFGIKVNEFCLGFGPTLIGFTKGDTKYAIKLLPLGGACMMEGEDEASSDEGAFNNKPLWQRFIVVAAGPVFNFILAYILAVVILFNVGIDKPVVTGVTAGYPAAEAGIRPGDEIVKLGNYPVSLYRDVSVYNIFNQGKELRVVFKRDGEKQEVSLTPKYSENLGKYLMGIEHRDVREKATILSSFRYGFSELKFQMFSTVQSLRLLVLRKVSADELSGPVGIVKAIGDTYTESAKEGIFVILMNMFSFTVLISANLGVMNLLPIPALDGGRLLIFIVEAIRRKKMDEEVEGRIHLVGFAFLMLLMALVLFNDVRKIFF